MAAPKGNQYTKGLTKENSGIGRPEKYTQEWCSEEANALLDWIKLPDNLFLQDFAWDRGYDPNRIAEFEKKSETFSGAIKEFKDRQLTKLLKFGLSRVFDSGFTQYTLPRICRDPVWKKSWDKEEDKADMAPPTIIINKIEK